MQVKLSELRKIIREELNRDYANFLYEQTEKDPADELSTDETVDWNAPEMDSDSANESDDEDGEGDDSKKNEIWPAVARVAGTFAAGKIADKLFEDEEADDKSSVKEDSYLEDKVVNESMNFDRFSRLWK